MDFTLGDLSQYKMIFGTTSNVGSGGSLTVTGANLVTYYRYTGAAGSSPYPSYLFVLSDLTTDVKMTSTSSTSSGNSNGVCLGFI